MKLIAIVLIVSGALALVYGGFTYTRETSDVSIGGMEISIDSNRRVNLPIWAGALLLTAGGGLLLLGGGRWRS